MEKEIWKPIPYEGFEDSYLVSNMGNFISLPKYNRKTIQPLNSNLNKYRGYCYVTLSKNGKTYGASSHRMVAKAFVHNPDPKNKTHVDHIDFNRTNNKASNLRWVSVSENLMHSRRAGRCSDAFGEFCGMSRLKNEQVINMYKLRSKGWKHKKIADKYGIKQCTVSLILSGARWPHIYKKMHNEA